MRGAVVRALRGLIVLAGVLVVSVAAFVSSAFVGYGSVAAVFAAVRRFG